MMEIKPPGQIEPRRLRNTRRSNHRPWRRFLSLKDRPRTTLSKKAQTVRTRDTVEIVRVQEASWQCSEYLNTWMERQQQFIGSC